MTNERLRQCCRTYSARVQCSTRSEFVQNVSVFDSLLYYENESKLRKRVTKDYLSVVVTAKP